MFFLVKNKGWSLPGPGRPDLILRRIGTAKFQPLRQPSLSAARAGNDQGCRPCRSAPPPTHLAFEVRIN